MSAVLALLSSLLWGTSDFLGGTASRRLPPYLVVGWADVLVVLGLTGVALGLGDVHFSGPLIGWSAGAGLIGLVGIGAFYQALADGAMGVVAPVAGLGVAVPIAVGIAEGDHPSGAQIAGMILAVAAIALVSSSGASADKTERSAGSARIMLLAVLAAASFGTVFVFLDKAEPYGTVATLLVMRLFGLGTLIVAALLIRPSVRITSVDLPFVAAVGAFDVGANACFQLATDTGQLAVVAVLSSLYPAVTAVLARTVHDERLSRAQLVGALLTVAAIVLLAAGSSA